MTTREPHGPAATGPDDTYCYPGTETLRNKLEIRDPAELRRAEYFLTTFNQATLPPVEASPDGLKAVHRHLFSDLYDWAGTFRTREMVRPTIAGDLPVTFARVADLEQLTKAAFSFIPTGHDHPVELVDFARQATGIAGAINWIHPFREGNGRTIRAFLTNWSRQQGHAIDFTQWSRQEWLLASTAAYHHNTAPMLDLIVSHLQRLDQDDLQRTIINWGQAHLDLDNLDNLIERADTTLQTTTATQRTGLVDTIGNLIDRRDGLVETIYELEQRLGIDARARGLGAWHLIDTAPPCSPDHSDQATLEAIGALHQHRTAWQPPAPANIDHQSVTDFNAIQQLHRRWTDNIVTRSTTRTIETGPDHTRTL